MTDQRERPHQELADVPEMGEEVEEVRVYRRAWIGRFLGPILAIVAYFALPAARGDLSRAGLATVSVGILMAVWWLTEALPLSATALTPIALFPLLGVVDTGAATAPYANDLIFLSMGGFMIVPAMQRWGCTTASLCLRSSPSARCPCG